MTQQKSQSLVLRSAAAGFVLATSWSMIISVPLSRPQVPSNEGGLQVEEQGDLHSSWLVEHAGLEERLDGTVGNLTIRNISQTELDGAQFYAEYFNRAGTRCFSLAFSQDRNIGPSGQLAPNESRELHTASPGLFPASEPSKVSVQLIREGHVDGGTTHVGGPLRFRSPVTIGGGLRADAAQVKLDITLAASGFSDVLLARVRVDSRGAVDTVEPLDALNDNVASWFNEFARSELTFFPAMDANTWVSEDALVLVRAFTREDANVQRAVVPPRMSPWVSAYVAKSPSAELPPITTILLRRPLTKVKLMGSSEWIERPPAAPGVFEIFLVGTDWSTPGTHMVGDPTAPHHMRRELSVSDTDAGLNERVEQQHR